ncbi:MAG TPA: CFI-box-CTERM domain-containing protein, partial [Nitrosopumilaceae archaeon]
KFEKLIERSRYYSELEIAESQVEAKTGVVDPTPAEVPKSEVEEQPSMEVNQTVVEEKPELDANQNGGGCLIATATFGTELASQVQMLREVRDTKVMGTEAGAMFLSGFNQLYYSFSPTIADLERQSPVFKEFVKITITPMLSSLSLLNHVDINSEEQMLGAGIGIISLNVGFYFGIPLVVALRLRRSH